MPKKGALSHSTIIKGALLYKDQLIKNYGSGKLGTYRTRAQIILQKQSPTQTPLKYNQKLIKCETTFSDLLKCITPELPTICDVTTCASSTCVDKIQKFGHISYVYNGNFEMLEKYIHERLCQTTNICNNENGENKCKELKTITSTISNKHIFIEVLEDIEDSSVQSPIKMKLTDIPLIINVKNTIYELRGVCAFSGGNLNGVGHYKAYCKRNDSNWELYDDLAEKSITIKSNSRVQCQYIFYTV